MGLVRYKAKRDFSRTREPAGNTSARRGRRSGFVVQKHAATRLHYDFRLQMGGVLKSWAVPKGIPTEKGERRLAMEVEDHPVEYGKFEGIIPPGNYGAGTVMLWDTGTYESLDADPEAAWKMGKLSLLLKGRKLKGHWALVRMKPDDERGKNPWLLIKTGEDVRAVSVRSDDTSVRSGRSMKQIAVGARKIWKSNAAKSDGNTKARSWTGKKKRSRT